MKNILITGTNRGIGLGLVRTLLSSKSVPKHIIATCRKPTEAKELNELAKSNSNVHIIQYERTSIDLRGKVCPFLGDWNSVIISLYGLSYPVGGEFIGPTCTIQYAYITDVTNFESLGKFHEEVSKIVGNDGLNVLINNAGIYGKSLKIGYLKPEAMLETFTVNTVAPVMLTKELLPLLRKAADSNADQGLGPSRAVVVNITSSLGSIAENDVGGYYPYRSSKAALNACTKSLSIDLKPYNILTTCIHPGWVKTDMGGSKAPMEVPESSQAIIQTIANLNESHNGCFLNYDGTTLPW